jgi:penicillin-binding protein 2
MKKRQHSFCVLFTLAAVVALLMGTPLEARTKKGKKKGHPMASKPGVATKVKPVASRRGRKGKRGKKQRVVAEQWSVPTFADSTLGDNVDGEDLVVRRAAVDALGPFNGSVLVVDPQTGRILTMVNQKLALKSGFQPCSTVKIYAALAALSEGLIDRNTGLRLSSHARMNLTEALARSNNSYFANLGTRLGFQKVTYYGRMYGLGEKAGLNIDGEQPGTLPDEVPPGGMGMMTSFGEGITLTPLQLAATVSAIANGGVLYYLQYPKNQYEVAQFVPRIKRRLDIEQWIPDLRPGMMGAVEYGTARRANYDPNEPIFGKTGTCTDERMPAHLGWFGSFNEVNGRKLVVVVLLTGGAPVSGPVASGIAGNVYHNLSQRNFFAQSRSLSPAALVSNPACCSR